jgi:hypothetical protein
MSRRYIAVLGPPELRRGPSKRMRDDHHIEHFDFASPPSTTEIASWTTPIDSDWVAISACMPNMDDPTNTRPATVDSVAGWFENLSVDEAASTIMTRDVVSQLNDIFKFFIRIGALEADEVSFGPHKFEEYEEDILRSEGYDRKTIFFMRSLPRTTKSINLDLNSPYISYFSQRKLSVSDFRELEEDDRVPRTLDLRNGKAVYEWPEETPDYVGGTSLPLTQWLPGSMGYHWVVDVEDGTLSRRHFAAELDEEETEMLNKFKEAKAKAKVSKKGDKKKDEEVPQGWHDDAVFLLTEHYKALENLDMIPISLWKMDDMNPGFVTRDEAVYKHVKMALFAYGWPKEFKRARWVQDLPDLVKGWMAMKAGTFDAVIEKEG